MLVFVAHGKCRFPREFTVRLPDDGKFVRERNANTVVLLHRKRKRINELKIYPTCNYYVSLVARGKTTGVDRTILRKTWTTLYFIMCNEMEDIICSCYYVYIFEDYTAITVILI